MKSLEKKSSIPLYEQIVEDIKQQIRQGQLGIDSKIMTEAELSMAYNVSRITVRKAIEILSEEGILVKKQGIGTFVATKKLTRDVSSIMGFTENCELLGCEASSKLLCAELITMEESDAKRLELSDNRAVRIVRIRFSDKEPVMIEENFFSPQYSFLLNEDLRGSLHKILSDHGIILRSCTKEISTCMANDDDKKYLNVEKDTALLFSDDLSFDNEGVPIYISRCKIDVAKYKLIIHLK